MIPTRPQVNNFKIARMGAAADQARRIGSAIDRAANLVRGTIAGLDWSGKARSAAVDRANREHVQLSRVSKAFDDLAQAVTDGMTSMGFIAGELKSKADGLEQDMYEVSDTWDVEDTYNYALGYAVAEANDNTAAISQLNALKAQRETARKAAEVQLKKLAGDFHTADTNCAAAVNAANSAINGLAPAASGIGGGSADSIMSRLNNGQKLTLTQLEQLRLATSLTPQQREALRHGKPAEMSQAQYDFLKKVVGGLDGKSMDEIMKLGHESQRGEVQRSLANGTMLLGAPNVTTKAGDKGGMAALPSNMRSLLTDNLIAPRGLLDKIGERVSAHAGQPHAPKMHSFFRFTDFIGQGDPDLRAGSDVNRGILKQVSELSGAEASTRPGINPHTGKLDPNYGYGITTDGGAYSREQLDAAMNRALNIAAVDKIAAHDFITGENMGVTCSDGGQYNANSHIKDLLRQDFGNETSGLKKLFSWVGSDGISPDEFDRTQAREAANALGKYLGSEENIKTNGFIGKINPDVAQAIAQAMAPYVAGLNGSDGLSGMPDMGVDELKHGDLGRFFQALNSDPNAAATINQAGKEWQNYLAYLYGLDPSQTGIGEHIGKLADAMRDGHDAEKNFLGQEELRVAQNRSTGFSVIKDVLGQIPGIQAMTPGMQERFFLGQPTTDTEGSSVIDTYNDENVLRYSQFLGHLDSLSPEALGRLQQAPESAKWFTNGEPDWNKVKDDPKWTQYMYDMTDGRYGDAYDRGMRTPDNAGEPTRDDSGRSAKPTPPVTPPPSKATPSGPR